MAGGGRAEGAAGSIVDLTAAQRQTPLGAAMDLLDKRVVWARRELVFEHVRRWGLSDMVDDARARKPGVVMQRPQTEAYLQPAGGILALVDRRGLRHPVLVADAISQPRSGSETAMPAGVDRVARMVAAVRAAMVGTRLMPYVCFADGPAFAEGATGRDHLLAACGFVPLGVVRVHDDGETPNPGSILPRDEPWSAEEMADRLFAVASIAIDHQLDMLGRGSLVLDG